MELEYKTITGESIAEFTERRSRFIGRLFPASSETQAQEIIARLKKEHWDAAHNIYAYILREGQVRRYSDDGEPQGTAGMPALEVLQGSGLTDCLAVVTRYFGGILLGTGGLVRAYSQGVRMAADKADMVLMRLCSRFELECDYSFYGKASALVPESGGILIDTQFTDTVRLAFLLPNGSVRDFTKQLTDMSAGSLSAAMQGEEFYPFRQKD